jgi:hypothetical protein
MGNQIFKNPGYIDWFRVNKVKSKTKRFKSLQEVRIYKFPKKGCVIEINLRAL